MFVSNVIRLPAIEIWAARFQHLKIIECTKVALCSRCDKEENSLGYLEEKSNNTNLQGFIEKEKEEVGTSDDNELLI